MLGRLQMDVEDRIDAYSELSRDIFRKKGLPIDWRGRVTGRYKSSELESLSRKSSSDQIVKKIVFRMRVKIKVIGCKLDEVFTGFASPCQFQPIS